MASGQFGDLLRGTSHYGKLGDSDIRTNRTFDMNEQIIEVEKARGMSNIILSNTGMHKADDQDPKISKMDENGRGLEDCVNNETNETFIPEHFLYSNENLKIEKETELNNLETDDRDIRLADFQDPNSRLENHMTNLVNSGLHMPGNDYNSNEGLNLVGVPAHKLYTRTLCAFGKDDFSCNTCGKTFKDKRDVIRHIRVHTGEKPFKCNICGYNFGCEYNLKRHLETHTGEKPYPCNICNRRFARKEYLQQHILLHSDDSEKPFPCHICSKGYVKRSYLERHLKTHVRVLEFFCSICGEGFYESRGLVSHMARLHSGNRPFPCSVCKQEFRKEHLLKKHMLTHTNSSITSELHSLFSNMPNQNDCLDVKHDKIESHESNIAVNSTDEELSALKERIMANVNKFTSVEDIKEIEPLSGNLEKINKVKDYQNFGYLETVDVDSGLLLKKESALHERVSQSKVEVSLENSTNENLLSSPHSLFQSSVHDIEKNKPTIGISDVVNIKKECQDLQTSETLSGYSGEIDKERLSLHNEISQSTVNGTLDNSTNEKLSLLHHSLFQPSAQDIGQAESPNGLPEASQNHLIQSTVKWPLDNFTGEGLSELHPVERPYSCSLCKKGFSKKTYLEQHMFTHGDISQRPFQCHICSNGFTKRSHYDRHLKTHSKVLEFFCTICGKGYFEKRGLTRHMQSMHSGIRPFRCSICQQDFQKEHLLTKHMISHINSHIKSHSSKEASEGHSILHSMLSQNDISRNVNDGKESHNLDTFRKLTDEGQSTVHPIFDQSLGDEIDRTVTPIAVPEIVIYNNNEINNRGTLDNS